MLRSVLPNILAFLSGHPRYLPEIEWSEKSWTHNAFRVYELVFWRREGIRCESASAVVDGRFVQQAFTVEASCALLETAVRRFLSRWSLVKVYIPALSPAGMPSFRPTPYLFAIAFDAATDGGTTGSPTTSDTTAHTCTGSDRFLAVAVRNIDGGDIVTGVTYATVALTRAVASAWPPNANTWSYLYYLFAPASGANNVVTTVSANSNQFSNAFTSYTGAAQSGTPDTGLLSATGSGNQVVTVTVTTANSWLVLGAYVSADADPTAVVNGVARVGSPAGNPSIFDSNGTVGSGSQTIGLTWGVSDRHVMVALAFAPLAASGPANLKTYNTNAAANIKTIDTNAIANVKTLDTNA